MELGVTDPVPALDTPAVSYQLQQGLWRGAQAGADPGLTDVLWSLFGTQRPGDVATVADLVIRCHKRDVTLSLELRSDLTMQRLVALDGQEEVGPLLLELPNNGRWVWSASAWISTPPRFSSPSNCRSTARS